MPHILSFSVSISQHKNSFKDIGHYKIITQAYLALLHFTLFSFANIVFVFFLCIVLRVCVCEYVQFYSLLSLHLPQLVLSHILCKHYLYWLDNLCHNVSVSHFCILDNYCNNNLSLCLMFLFIFNSHYFLEVESLGLN